MTRLFIVLALSLAAIAGVLTFAGPAQRAGQRGQYAPLEASQVLDTLDCDFAGIPRQCAGHVHFQLDARDRTYVGSTEGSIVLYAPACSRVLWTTSKHPEEELARNVDYSGGVEQDDSPLIISPVEEAPSPQAHQCKQYPVKVGVTWTARADVAALSTRSPF